MAVAVNPHPLELGVLDVLHAGLLQEQLGAVVGP
jgi:hypothetical protein